jgi:DNA modification methylase
MRLKALKELGIKEVPTKILPSDTPIEKLKAYTIKDNVSFGDHDWSLLSEWDSEQLEDWGLEVPSFETEVLEAQEDDFDTTPPEEPITVLGDLYEIGEHRLLCGDSTDSDQVAKLMNGSKADMVFTDPPYGIDYSGGRTQVVETKSYGKLMNDDLQGVELGDLISNVFLFNKQEADVYICVSPKMQKPFLDFIENSNKVIDAVIVWDKKQPGLGYMAYRRQCEFILFIKGGAFKKGDNSDFDLWSISRDNGQDYVHGTQKPLGVPSRAINNSSKKDDLVLDYFGGSGSTMVASHQLKRKCYGMELDPKYCDVIVKRMIKLDPTLIVKRNGVVTKDFEL